MPEPSTTPGDNPTNNDAKAEGTTVTDPQPGTDNQPAPTGDNLDEASKSDDKTPADDKKPADDNKPDDGKPAEGTEDAPASQLDEDLDEWIEKRKLPPATTDEQKQEYQNLRNSQREYTREQQAKKDAADLASTVDDLKEENKPDPDDDDDEDDELAKDVKELKARDEAREVTRLQSEFYTSNKVTSEEGKQITDILKEKIASRPTKEGKIAALELWSKPEMLPDLLDIARARLTKATDTSAVADEAARLERERIAKESNANSPSRAASSTTTSDPSEDEARRKRFEERYKK